MSPRENITELDDELNEVIYSEEIVNAVENRSLSLKYTPDDKIKRKRVEFGTIEIREYARIVGDHPDVKVGPPIALGWEHFQREPMPLSDYESNRPPKRIVLRMSSITRKNLLRNVFDVPESEIRAAEKENIRIQKLRERSANQSVVVAKVEDVFRRRTRKLMNVLSSDLLFKSFSHASQGLMPMHVH